MKQAENKTAPAGWGKALALFFLLALFGVPATDEALFRIQAAAKPEKTGDIFFLRQPYKPGVERAYREYGYLSKALVAPQLIEEYGELFTFRMKTDARGFADVPGVTPDNCNIAVAGDSFTLGLKNSDSVAGGIAALDPPGSFRPLDLGFPGSSSNSVLSFLRAFPPADGAAPRRLLLLVLVKRNLIGEIVSDIPQRVSPSKKSVAKHLIARYLPANFYKLVRKRSVIIPHASSLAAAAAVELGTFSIPGNVTVGREKMLFLTEEITLLDSVSGESRKTFLETMEFIRREADARGFDLALMAVPDKSDVYPQLLPDDAARPATDAEKWFAALENELSANGILVLNMLPVMRAAATDGPLLFYMDDPHWNSAGRDIAVRATAPLLEKYAR